MYTSDVPMFWEMLEVPFIEQKCDDSSRSRPELAAPFFVCAPDRPRHLDDNQDLKRLKAFGVGMRLKGTDSVDP